MLKGDYCFEWVNVVMLYVEILPTPKGGTRRNWAIFELSLMARIQNSE